MAKLTFVLEDGQEIVVPLAEHMTVGRWEDNDVVVDDERVSKHHAELVRNADGSIQLFDSSSTAGTFVNGERILSHTLRDGDKLAFGPLTAVLDASEETASDGSTTSSVAEGSKTQSLPLNTPVKADKIATRKRPKNGRQTAPPAQDLPPDTEANASQEKEKSRLQSELESLQKELRSWQEHSSAEHAMHQSRVESLRAEEEHLGSVRTALQEAKEAHEEWLAAIQALASRHEEQNASLQSLTALHAEKSAEMRRLADNETAAREEMRKLSAQQEQAQARLQQLRSESAHEEASLAALQSQVAELEARSRHSQELADVRTDQLKAAEKKQEQLSQQRAQIEARIRDLSDSEEKLRQALARCQEAEAQHASIAAATSALSLEQQRTTDAVKELESVIAALREAHQQTVATTEQARTYRLHAEESLHHTQEALAATEAELATRKAGLAAETLRLEAAQARRAELEKQCHELADTGLKLDAVKSQLAAAEQQLTEKDASLAAAVASTAEQAALLQSLAADETAAKSRIDVLQSREKDLHAALASLSSAERIQRSRFEEVRQLASEAEREHTSQKERLSARQESAHSELQDLLAKLQPLRDWKEAMDQLYSRLSTLPQDSAEARQLWHEIEKEKEGLHALIINARTQAHAVASQRGSTSSATLKSATPTVSRSGPGAAPVPGSAQETTLRSRLNHLRESVQREESRLEQLRLERTRHETSQRSGPAAEAMLREQSRHLEARIRQDQERHHALVRSIEMHQAEEEKRRERLLELEHKLAELRTSVAEAESLRGELRQQAGLAQVELKNFEAAIDRSSQKTVH